MPPRSFLPLLVLALSLLLPGAAAASSIAFIKDNNVWLTSPDGSRQHQVTTDGNATKYYNWPSQADDGTILAKHGDHFVRMRPDGTKIGAPVPGLGSDYTHSGNVFVLAGPNNPRISPDGKRFSYWVSVRGMVTCPIWDPGCSYDDTDYTIVSHVDRFTDPGELGAVRDYRDPSWIGNDRLLVFNYGLGVKSGAISPVGAGEPALQQWFNGPYHLQIGQGQLTRQGDKLVTLAGSAAFGPAQEHLFLYAVGGYPAEPAPACYIAEAEPPSGKFLIPSWSPDGTAVAVTESDGIHVYENIPDLRVPSPDCGAITERVLVRGSAPAWGPADVPGAQPPAPPPPPPKPDGGGPAGPTAALGDVVAKRRQRGRAVRVRVDVLAGGAKVRVRLLSVRRKPMGSAVRLAKQAGPLTLSVPLDRRGRAALRRAGRLKLSVRVAVQSPGGAPAAAVRKVTLRR
jgi:hypothetical protein